MAAQPPLRRFRSACGVLLLVVSHINASLVMALPGGVSVQSGDLTLSYGPDSLQIQQGSHNAIANWQDFSIGLNQQVNIVQPSQQAALLNRVTGANMSQLLGQLNANGQVYLVNPNGVLIGENASINAGEFVASALNITDADFLNRSDLLFSGNSQGQVLNLGSITSSSGDILLVAAAVANRGSLSAPQGQVALATGSEVLLSRGDNQRLMVKTSLNSPAAETAIDNSGLIEAVEVAMLAAGGEMYDLAINQSGVVRATGIEQRNGRILLTAANGSIDFSGAASASNADGSGGAVFIGGGLRGASDLLDTAAHTRLDAAAVIDVRGDGADAGQAIVWADDSTRFDGRILASSNSGNGGFVEVSGKQQLEFNGLVQLQAPNGNAGTLLLDPDALTIQAASPGANVLLVSALEAQLASGNVVLDASAVGAENGIISFNDAVAWTSGNSLTVEAGDSININASLNAGSADIALGLGFIDEFAGPGGPQARLQVAPAASLTASSLAIRRNANASLQFSNSFDGPMGSIDIQGAVDVDTLDIRLSQAGFFDPGIQGNVSVTNSANRIGLLTNSGDSNAVGGSFNLVSSSGNLQVSANFAVQGNISLVADGKLELLAGTSLTTGASGGDLVLASQSGSFINGAGAIALVAGGSGRTLIYSDSPDNTALGGFSASPLYNRTFAANAPGTISQTGNRVLYSLAPTLVLSADNKARAENEANPTLTYSVSGLVGSDTAASAFSGSPLLDTDALESSPIGDYDIRINQGSVALTDLGYALSLVDGTLSVQVDPLRELRITADDISRIYGDANPAFTASFEGFRTGDSENLVSGLQFATAATANSPVGTYSITPFGATATNYAVTFVPGTLSIELRDLTITADSASKLFGQALPELGFSIDGLAQVDTQASLGSISTTSGGTAALADVGTYGVVASGVVNPNYRVTYVAGSLEVAPAPLTIRVSDQQRLYGSPNPTFTVSTTGLASGDSLNLAGLVFNTAATAQSNVGNYGVNVAGLVDNNYSISYQPGNLQILRAPLSLTANSFSRLYGAANPAFTYSISPLAGGDQLADVLGDIQLTSLATQATDVGSYAIDLTATQISDNYDVTLTDGTLTITKAPLDLFISAASRLYGESNPTPEVVAFGLVNGDTTAVLRSLFISSPAPITASVGTYPVQFLGADASNYRINSLTDGILNVLPRPLTIAANSFTREYGSPNPVFTANFTGLAAHDSPAAISGLAFSTPATQSSHVLDWGISVNSNPNPNYQITYQPGILSVVPAPLSLQVQDSERLYGRATPEFQLTSLVGIKLDDNLDSIGLQYVTDAVPTSGAGEYAIGATISSPNYSLSVVPGTFYIRPAPLSISLTNQARIYGEANPDLPELSVAGLAFGDLPEQVVLLENPTNVESFVGTYNFNFSITNPNYQLQSLSGGLFTILKRQIAIKPANVVRYYGDPDPQVNYLVAGDGLPGFASLNDILFLDGLLYSGSIGQQAPVGVRTTLAQLRNNPNYSVANRQGYYAILPRPIEITVDNAEAVGGQPLPQFTASASNLAPFDDFGLAFPNLRFLVYRTDEPAPVQQALALDEFDIPLVFTDDNFFASYPSRLVDPDAAIDPVEESIGSEVEPIEIEFSADPVTSFTIELPAFTLSSVISNQLVTPEEEQAEEPVVQYIQARGSNPNYAVVAVNSGELLWSPSPEVAAQRELIKREQAAYDSAYNSLWNPVAEYGAGAGNLLNVPAGAEQTLIFALARRLAIEEEGGFQLLNNAMARFAREALDQDSDQGGLQVLTGGAFSDFDALAFLQAARTDERAAELLGEIYADYVTALVASDPARHSPAEQILLQELSVRAGQVRDNMANRMEAEYQNWLSAQEARSSGTNLAGLFGTDVPYAEFMGDAAGDFVAENIGAAVAGAAAVGAAGAATAAAMLGGTAAILPFALGSVTTSTVLGVSVTTTAVASSSASIAGGTATLGASAAATVAAPVAIVAVAVAGSIARGVQVFNNAAQANLYQQWLDSRGTPMDITSLSLTDDRGNDNPVDQAILLGAITSMLSGS